MPSSQPTRERLKQYENPHYQKDQLQRLLPLRGELSSIGQILIQAGPAWAKVSNDYQQINQARRKAIDQLGDLKPPQLKKLCNALFPKIADEVIATWELFDRLPYQTGHQRRPFRKPHDHSPMARSAWLQKLVFATDGYDQGVSWFAAWAPYLGFFAPDALGYLFAGAIEKGGETGQGVFDLLMASGNGSHEIGAMGRHVVRGLLCSSRREGWEFIERMLLAAQREEGLRQVILESIDEAHPEAFRRMLDLILEHNLIRFSAALRAFDVWFGLALDTTGQRTVHEILTQVMVYLDDPWEAEKSVREGTAQEAYYALWSMAFKDATLALPHAIELRHSAEVEHRFAATHLLAQMELVGSFNELLNALNDEDMRVAARAAVALASTHYRQELKTESDLFERIELFLPRLPSKQNAYQSPVWDWQTIQLDRDLVTGMLIDSFGKRSPKRLIQYLPMMNSDNRAKVAALLKGQPKKDAETRQALLSLVGDRSSYVRASALDAIHDIKLTVAEILQLEELLSRKAADLRQGVIKLLLDLPDRRLMESIGRLLEGKGERQRMAGLELLREYKQAGRREETAGLRLAHEFRQTRDLTEIEARLLEDILEEDHEEYSLDDALGLMEPRNRTKPTPPPSEAKLFGLTSKVKPGTPAAAACLQSLDELIEVHRAEPVEIVQLELQKTELLGNIRWGFPRPDVTRPLNLDRRRLPLHDVWENWWSTRPEALRDKDGQELTRALALSHLFSPRWVGAMQYVAEVPKQYQKSFNVKLDFKLNYHPIIQAILEWLVWMHPADGETNFILDALEASISRIPSAELRGVNENHYMNSRTRTIPLQRLCYLITTRWLRRSRPETWNCEHHRRLWQVVRWIDEPEPGLPRFHPELEDALLAYECEAASRDDLLDLMLGPREIPKYGGNFQQLYKLSGRHPHPYFRQYPILKELVEGCRERILSIETRRGDLPTAATMPALNLRSVPGQHNLFRLLTAMGKAKFERGYSGQSRSAALSHLIRNSFPTESNTREGFSDQARELNITQRRLVELAVYAPQWAAFIEFTLSWKNFEEAVWWVYAHTKDRQWSVSQEIREEWALRISEYTPLSADSLMDGAVDVAWFQRVYSTLGEKRWAQIHQAALYAAGGKGHTRARLFADAMSGKVPSGALIDRINKKRHQDSVRALGLVPLPNGEDPQAELLHRYEVMQEFLRTSKKYGSQRQASEKLAVAIGMQNLARTAGYLDPQRLEWAMEIEAVTDLAEGPVVVESGESRLTLAINYLGEPKLTVTKKGKNLKSIPRGIKKDPRITGLLERKRKLDRQVSRMRLSLERAMIRGDSFTGVEIGDFFQHPMLRVMLEQLIFTDESTMGYPVEGGRALLSHSGNTIPLGPEEKLRIAHPVDLLESGAWHLWQHECFFSERIQPFKQVFRELYPLTEAEKAEGNQSYRYAGQQLNPRQALALFGSRGWVTDPEEGVQKTFYDLGVTARVGFSQGVFTPVEVEGLTMEVVAFTRRGEWTPLPLDQIALRVFSEVMRDLDLVVSVAHAGGVDPEASASSIEAREALVRETCDLLNLHNVRIKNRHAVIEGKLGNYTIHLGSAVVHKQPGGSVCIIPVHSQHRGRLFLPFVDQDPKSAEVISKVILLANDQDIRDPTILEQIRN